MEGEVITKGFGLLVFGTLFVWLGVDGWRRRWKDRITLIEATILKAGGEAEPLPYNRWDKMMAYIQPVLMLLFGPVMVFLGCLILFV